MITLNDTPTTDAGIVWIIEIVDDAKTYYLATDDMTLSGQAYDGNVLLDESLSNASKDVDISEGGSIGSVGSFSFAVGEKSDNTDWDDLQDDFYPNNTTYLTGRKVRFGVVWNTATTQAEITYLHLYVIEDIHWDTAYKIDCIEYVEHEASFLPPYEVQESYDNSISYFTNALKEAYGTPIPIIYGEFPLTTTANIQEYDFSLAPTIPIDKLQLKFIVACHKCDSFAVTQLYKFYDDVEGYFNLEGRQRAGAGSFNNIESIDNFTNGVGHCKATLLTQGGFIAATGYMHPNYNVGDFNAYGSAYAPTEQSVDIMDRDLDTYITLAPGAELHIGFDSAEAGEGLDEAAVDGNKLALQIKTLAVGGNADFRIRITTTGGLSKAQLEDGDLNLRVLTGGKYYKDYTATTGGESWDLTNLIYSSTIPLKELMNHGVHIENLDGSDSIRFYEVYWLLEDVEVADVMKKGGRIQKVRLHGTPHGSYTARNGSRG